MKSSWCGFSGLGVAVPVGKDQDVCPGQFYDSSVLLCPRKKCTGYHSCSYCAFFMQNLHKERRVGLFSQSSNKITMSIFSFMAG